MASSSPPRSPGADSSDFALRLSLTEPENRVKVYSRAATAQLTDTRGFAGNTSSVSRLLPRTGGAKRPSAEQAHAARVAGLRENNREILRQRHQRQLEKTLARHRRGREREKDKEHTKFEAMYASVVAEEAGFIQDVEAFMHAQARQEVRKREALHKQWDEAIYQKVQAEINAHLDKRNINDISAKRYALMDEYVRVSNSKTFGLFRDIIIPEEYDPMTAHGDFIKYDARERFDPCKLELRGAAAELGPAAVSGFAKAGDLSDRFPPTMWDKLEVGPLLCHAPPCTRTRHLGVASPPPPPPAAAASLLTPHNHQIPTTSFSTTATTTTSTATTASAAAAAAASAAAAAAALHTHTTRRKPPRAASPRAPPLLSRTPHPAPPPPPPPPSRPRPRPPEKSITPPRGGGGEGGGAPPPPGRTPPPPPVCRRRRTAASIRSCRRR